MPFYSPSFCLFILELFGIVNNFEECKASGDEGSWETPLCGTLAWCLAFFVRARAELLFLWDSLLRKAWRVEVGGEEGGLCPRRMQTQTWEGSRKVFRKRREHREGSPEALGTRLSLCSGQTWCSGRNCTWFGRPALAKPLRKGVIWANHYSLGFSYSPWTKSGLLIQYCEKIIDNNTCRSN